MPRPANLAVIRDNRRELYRDRGCDGELDMELVWGPELALSYIRGRWSADEWYEGYQCDAGVVLDCNRRHMTFYNGDICPEVKSAILFGSRALGSAGVASDIDLAIDGVDRSAEADGEGLRSAVDRMASMEAIDDR